MPRYFIGMDEAGYGPNLGPLVISATIWSVPDDWPQEQFWSEFSDFWTNAPKRSDPRLHIADSKEVYSSGKGLKRLEESVHALISICDSRQDKHPANLTDMIRFACGGNTPESCQRQPWMNESDPAVPVLPDSQWSDSEIEKLKQAVNQKGVQLAGVLVRLVFPEDFNRGVEECGNKSTLLTTTSFGLLSELIVRFPGMHEIRADKHGGRNRYLPQLLEAFPDQFFSAEVESKDESRYRSKSISISLATKSERFFPVAAASLFAKYLRELCMEQFNAYWQKRCPGLKPTKGYPVDAARFRKEIAEAWQEHQLSDDILWRAR